MRARIRGGCPLPDALKVPSTPLGQRAARTQPVRSLHRLTAFASPLSSLSETLELRELKKLSFPSPVRASELGVAAITVPVKALMCHCVHPLALLKPLVWLVWRAGAGCVLCGSSRRHQQLHRMVWQGRSGPRPRVRGGSVMPLIFGVLSCQRLCHAVRRAISSLSSPQWRTYTRGMLHLWSRTAARRTRL